MDSRPSSASFGRVKNELARRPRGRPLAGEAPASPDQVLAAALAAFARDGYAGMSVRTLCRELGVSHNLLHQRFGSKQRLWEAAMDAGFGGLVEHLRAGFDPTLTPLEQLHRGIMRFILFSAEHPELTAIMNAEGVSPSPRLAYIFERYIGPATAPAAALLEHLAADGVIRPVPLSTFQYLVTSGGAAPYGLKALTELFDASASGSPAPPSPEEHARLVADTIIEGLSVR